MEGKSAIYQLTKHVIEEGSKTFAFIGYPDGSISIKDRLDGMIQALDENKIRRDDCSFFTEHREDYYYSYATVV